MRTGLDPAPRAVSHTAVPGICRTLARQYGYAIARQHGTGAAVDIVCGGKLDDRNILNVTKQLLCIGRYDTPASASRGERISHVFGARSFATTASAFGAGCDGSLLALCSLKSWQVRDITRSRLGKLAMTLYPWAIPGEFTNDGAPGNQVLLTNIVPVCRSTFMADHSSACRLCNTGTESPLHFFLHCSHPHIVANRSKLFRSATGVVQHLVSLLHREHDRFWGDSAPREVLESARRVVQILKDPSFAWASEDGHTLLSHLVTASPFSAFDVRHQLTNGATRAELTSKKATLPVAQNLHLPLTLAFGGLLDATTLPRSKLRPYANAWVRWAHRTIMQLVGLHACARGNSRLDAPCLCSPRKISQQSCPAPAHGLPDFTDIPEPIIADEQLHIHSIFED
jgi:hypothetical protein